MTGPSDRMWQVHAEYTNAVFLFLLFVTRTLLLVAPGIATGSKKLLVAPGIILFVDLSFRPFFLSYKMSKWVEDAPRMNGATTQEPFTLCLSIWASEEPSRCEVESLNIHTERFQMNEEPFSL